MANHRARTPVVDWSQPACVFVILMFATSLAEAGLPRRWPLSASDSSVVASRIVVAVASDQSNAHFAVGRDTQAPGLGT